MLFLVQVIDALAADSMVRRLDAVRCIEVDDVNGTIPKRAKVTIVRRKASHQR